MQNFRFPARSVIRATGLFPVVLACCLSCLHTIEAFAAAFEKPGTVSAQTLLKPEQLKGPYHTVNDAVRHDGLYFKYTVQSPFGSFQPTSTFALDILIKELDAIAAMKKVETSDTAVQSLKASGERTATGIKNLFTEPGETLEGAAEGVSNLFNRAKQTIGHRKTTETEDSKFAQVVGFTKSKGDIATKFGVSMYSSNQALQEELDRLAMADYLGGISVGAATAAIPGVGGAVLTTSGSARILNDVINNTPPSRLWVQNKNKMKAMGFDPDTVELFLNNPVFTPALHTVLVSALESMKEVANRDIFIKIGLQASNPDMARTITDMAVLAAGYHRQVAPLKRFAPMARVACGVKRDGTTVVLLPTDYLIWSERIADVAENMASRREKGGGNPEIWTLGTLSPQAKTAMKAQGWTVHEQAAATLLAAKGR